MNNPIPASPTSSSAGGRRYLRSSSFQMALLFTLLLGSAGGILGYVIYRLDENGANAGNLQILGIVALVLMGLVIAVSYALSTFVVSRTNRIASSAQSIMQTGDLSQRLALDSGWDDLGHMTSVLNALLGRIEDLVQGVRQVSDNIAHDLRTPLARLRGDLENLKSHAAAQDPDIQAACDKMLVEADRLLGTFAALLRIAKVETTYDTTAFRPTDLAALLADVAELYEPLAEDKNITLETTFGAVPAIAADRDLLFQTFANLVDNAVKFTPAGGRITLQVQREGEKVAVVIKDSGPGITESEMAHVFKRFYRAEQSRTSEGNGLGLSLVDAVLTLHHAQRQMRNTQPGLEVAVWFHVA